MFFAEGALRGLWQSPGHHAGIYYYYYYYYYS